MMLLSTSLIYTPPNLVLLSTSVQQIRQLEIYIGLPIFLFTHTQSSTVQSPTPPAKMLLIGCKISRLRRKKKTHAMYDAATDFEVVAHNVVASLHDCYVKAGQSEKNSRVPIDNLIAVVDRAFQREKRQFELEFPPYHDAEEATATFRIFTEGVCKMFVAFLIEHVTDLNKLSFADVRNGLSFSLENVNSREWFQVYWDTLIEPVLF